MSFERQSEVYSEVEFYEASQLPRNSAQWNKLMFGTLTAPPTTAAAAAPPPAVPKRAASPVQPSPSAPSPSSTAKRVVVVAHRLPSVRQHVAVAANATNRKTVQLNAPPLAPARAPPLPPPSLTQPPPPSIVRRPASPPPPSAAALSASPPPTMHSPVPDRRGADSATATTVVPDRRVVAQPERVKRRPGRQTVTKPADVQKRTIVPARELGVGRSLIIDERSVAQRRSILALRPSLCELCGARVPVARLVRNNFGFWACKLCVRSARTEFEQYGTLRGTRLTIKTRTPIASARGPSNLTLPAPRTALADSHAQLQQRKPPPLQPPPTIASGSLPPSAPGSRKPTPQPPPPHTPAARPPAPIRHKATPEALGFALDIAEIEDLLQESTSDYTPASNLDEEDMDDDSAEITNLFDYLTGAQSYATRGAIRQFDTPPPDDLLEHTPDAPRRGDTFERDSFRDKHGSVRSVVFIDNEDEIFANLDGDDDGNVVVDYLDEDDDDAVQNALGRLPQPPAT